MHHRVALFFEDARHGVVLHPVKTGYLERARGRLGEDRALSEMAEEAHGALGDRGLERVVVAPYGLTHVEQEAVVAREMDAVGDGDALVVAAPHFVEAREGDPRAFDANDFGGVVDDDLQKGVVEEHTHGPAVYRAALSGGEWFGLGSPASCPKVVLSSLSRRLASPPWR
jgi:hypothetical protein